MFLASQPVLSDVNYCGDCLQEALSPQLQPLKMSRPCSAVGVQPWNLAALQPQVLRALRGSTDSVAVGGGSGTRGGCEGAHVSAEVRVDLGKAGGSSSPPMSVVSAGAVASPGGTGVARGSAAKPGRSAAECGGGSEVVEALLDSTSARWTGDTQGAVCPGRTYCGGVCGCGGLLVHAGCALLLVRTLGCGRFAADGGCGNSAAVVFAILCHACIPGVEPGGPEWQPRPAPRCRFRLVPEPVSTAFLCCARGCRLRRAPSVLCHMMALQASEFAAWPRQDVLHHLVLPLGLLQASPVIHA